MNENKDAMKPAKVKPRNSLVYVDESLTPETCNSGYEKYIKVKLNQFDTAVDVLFTPVSECPYHELSYLHGSNDTLTIYNQGNGLILVTNSGRRMKSIGFAGFDKEGLEKVVNELGLPI